MNKNPIPQDLQILIDRVHPNFKPVWDGLDQEKDRLALAAYFLPHRSQKQVLAPTRPKVIKWYCPFAAQCDFPSGHRYCINVFVGCSHRCVYCYAASYQPKEATCKKDFEKGVDKDLEDLERFDVPPAPLHLSNSTDPFQLLETHTGHTQYALERVLAYRHRFTTITCLTKNPNLPVQLGYIPLFRQLGEQSTPPLHDENQHNRNVPLFQAEVSLAFWREEAATAYDPDAPSVEERIEGIRALREAGIPVVLRIDPLLPRSPLPVYPPKTLDDFGLCEAQNLDDLERLVAFAQEVDVRHVVFSPAKIVRPRRGRLHPLMQAWRQVYVEMSAPKKPVWRSFSWRLPAPIAEQHVTGPFLAICQKYGVEAKFCMKNLVETS
jgi:DNA repair photolyase